MSILAPTPFLGWNSVYKGPVNYIALARSLDSGSPVPLTNLHYRVSGDGRRWHQAKLSGDLADHRKGGSGELGAFYPEGTIWFLGRLFIYGRLWDDGNNSRAAVFVTDDGREINRIATAIDGTEGSSGLKHFADAAVTSDNKLVLLCSSGELAISTNGTSFSTQANIGFTGTMPARAIAAGTGVIVAAGASGQGFSAADPAGAWTSRNLQFGTSEIQKLDAGNVFVAAGAGKLSTSALTSGATWVVQTDPVGGSFDYLDYVSDRWFGAGITAKWITSTSGTTAWSTPAQKPYIASERVQASIWDGSELLIFLSGGKGSVSDDLTTWDRDIMTGLAAENYVAVAKLS